MNYKRNNLIPLIVIATLIGLAACGGGGGDGGGGGSPPATTLPAGTFTKTVELSAPGGSSLAYPFSASATGSRVQYLLRAGDMNGSGPIRSLAFRFDIDSAGNTCPDVTIKLGHSSKTDLVTEFSSNIEEGRGSVLTVYGPATLTIPTGAVDEYFTIPLSSGFNYNGVDNLVVDITSGTCAISTSLKSSASSASYIAGLFAGDSTAPEGGALAHIPNMKFTFAGGGDAVTYINSPGANASPFSDAADPKIQLLYPAAEINGSGPITGIAFPIVADPGPATAAAQTYTATVKLGHTTRNGLTTIFADNFNAGAPVTVANGVSFTVPAGTPSLRYVWFPLPDGVFTYNGADNLLVEIDVTSATGETLWFSHVNSTGAMTRLYGASGAAEGAGVDDSAYDIRFRFHGGTMDALTPNGMPAGTFDSFPFYQVDGKRQYLHLASELGAKGVISKIACRASSDSAGESGFNYSVVMSHTPAATLGSEFSSNLVDPVTVFNGPFSIPQLLKGDWVEVTLSTPFVYNGKDNLVVQIAGTGGADLGTACIAEASSLYAGRWVGYPSSTAPRGSLSNIHADMRFFIQ